MTMNLLKLKYDILVFKSLIVFFILSDY